MTCLYSVLSRPQFADGEEGLPIWKAAANIGLLNEQSQTTDNG
jgi:hypothetical protein